MEIRKYQLKIRKRRSIDLTDYEECIKRAYDHIPGISVQVENDCYFVYGNITDGQLRIAGSYIARNSELGKYCKRYGTSTQLFKCAEKKEVPDEWLTSEKNS